MRRAIGSLLIVTVALVIGACGGASSAGKSSPAEPRKAGVEVVAHRGGLPENTLSAFRKALAHPGVGAIETDVQLSKDLIPYIMHDPKVDRTTNGTGEVRSLMAKDLDGLRTPKGGGKDKVPSLAELAELTAKHPGKRLFLEIKAPAPKETPALVLQAIQAHKIDGRTIVMSFDAGIMDEVHRLAPDQTIGLVVREINDKVLSFPGQYLIVRHTALNKQTVAKVREAGKFLYAWTVNQEGEMQAMLALGVDGLVSDQYERAAAVSKP